MTIYPGQTESSWNPQSTKFISDNLFLRIVMHVTFLFGLFPSFIQDNILPNWSIGLEMQFYAVFPFIVLLIRKIGYTIPIILFSIIYLTAPLLFGLYNSPGLLLHFGQPSFLPLKINVFLIGILLGKAKYFIAVDEQSKAIKTLLFVLVLSFVAYDFIINLSAIYLFFWVSSSFYKSYSPLKQMFLKMDRFLDNNVITFFFNTSFAVYLLHLIVIYTGNGFFVRFDFYMATNNLGRFFILLPFCIPVSYLIAHYIFKLVEGPFINLGKSLIPRFYSKRELVVKVFMLIFLLNKIN
jgi:peptidoglycan/LPS O-acetylase OafA/YrhL